MDSALLMPKLGLTMTEGLIAEWAIAPGAACKAGACLFVVETEKVATEVPAETDGVLVEIVVAAGQTVAVGTVVGYWRAAGASAEPQPAAANTATQAAPAEPFAVAAMPAGARIISTPLARRTAAQLGLDIASVSGSGPRGRIKAADVQAHADRGAAASGAGAGAGDGSDTAQPVAASARVDTGSSSTPGSVQAAMARRLVEAKQQVPHFYLALDAGVDELLKLRSAINAQTGAGLTLNHFVVAAAGRALADLPQANRIWSEGRIVSFHSTDVGIAVHTARGLFVPIVRDAGRIGMERLAASARLAVEAAREGRLTLDDTAGGAITISNAGMHHVKYMTPIINPGQAMILGVGSILGVFRPDALGLPVLRQEMGLVLAADHRILDGVGALAFLNRVVAYLEQPLKLLVGLSLPNGE